MGPLLLFAIHGGVEKLQSCLFLALANFWENSCFHPCVFLQHHQVEFILLKRSEPSFLWRSSKKQLLIIRVQDTRRYSSAVHLLFLSCSSVVSLLWFHLSAFI